VCIYTHTVCVFVRICTYAYVCPHTQVKPLSDTQNQPVAQSWRRPGFSGGAPHRQLALTRSRHERSGPRSTTVTNTKVRKARPRRERLGVRVCARRDQTPRGCSGCCEPRGDGRGSQCASEHACGDTRSRVHQPFAQRLTARLDVGAHVSKET